MLVYAAERTCPEHARMRAQLDGWRARQERWYLSWNILYEFLRVTTHPRVFRTPWRLAEAWRFVEALLASPGLALLAPTERHHAVAAEVARELPDLRGNLLHDCHTAVLMREHGIRRLYTCDTDFHRFPFLEIVNPLS